MELPSVFRGLIGKMSGKPAVSVEKAQDPVFTAGLERISRSTLVRLYTDPKALESLGTLPQSIAGFQRFGEEITRTETEAGINSNIVPHLTANLKAAMAQGADIVALTREQALARVSSDRREAIEKEAFLEAQRILNEKLKEEGLSQSYRTGATEMLRRIEDRLKERPALSEENPA